MRIFIETVTGRKGYKSFKNLNEYIDFMTEKGHMIKTLKEADLPYSDKPVKLPKVSKSTGWEEVSDFGDIDREAEKGDSLIASTSTSVMKDEASMDVSKSSEAKDKPEMGLGAEKGDTEMADFKEFKYEEPDMKSSETKETAPKAEEPKKESSDEKKEKPEPKEEDKEEKPESKEDEKKEEESEEDKEIKEALRIAGVNLEEGIKDGISSWKDKFKSIVSKVLNKKEMPVEKQFLKIIDSARWTDNMPSNASPQSLLLLAAMVSDLKDNGRLNDFINNNYDKCISLINKLYTKKIGDYDLDNDEDANSFLDESIKDYLPRAGFIRDDDEDKESRKMGIWGGQGTDDQLKKAKMIAKVKFANGDRMGRVTRADLDNFEEYKRQYDEIYGSDEELEEGYDDSVVDDYVDNLDAFVSDYYYDNAELQSEVDYEFIEANKQKIFDIWKEKMENGEEEWQAAEDAYNEAKDEDKVLSEESFDEEIEECLKYAR